MKNSHNYPSEKRVLLIYTGGTIGMDENPQTGALEPLDFDHLVECVPEFKRISVKVDTHQFVPPIDSSDMQPANWVQIVEIIENNYDDYCGFVILHGTDTMAYTASALSFMLENLTKPVVLTGSQLPIGKLRTDGKENLITSIEIAAAYKECRMQNAECRMQDNPQTTAQPNSASCILHSAFPIVPEVCIYFSGKLLRGNRATKINAEGFAAFDSFNYPHLGDAGINIHYHEANILKPDFTKPLVTHKEIDPNVVVFSLFPGVQESIISHVTDAPELRSVVMRTYGSGNAPQQPWMFELLKKATEKGVNIVNISQCLSGRVEMERYGTGFHLSQAGVISGEDATVEATVTKLMVLQGELKDQQKVREAMQKPLAGEFTE